jgi:hypothetical protein
MESSRLRQPFRSLALALPVVAMAVMSGYGQQAGPALPPLPYPVLQNLVQDPVAWQQFLAEHASMPSAEPASASLQPINGLAWAPLTNLLPGNQSASNPLLLTDGTVLVHVSCTNRWYRLKPSPSGTYQNGTWSMVAPMVASISQTYTPRFFASAVLPDGRAIAEGGEYDGSGCTTIESSLGAIYSPRTNSWTPVSPPPGWTQIGDASSIVLTKGAYLLSNATTKKTALLDTTNLTWINTGPGKFDYNSEENWTLLPNGDVLTVDAYGRTGTCGTNSEEYQPPPLGNWSWVTAGSTIHDLSGCNGSIKNGEAPTQILQPNGVVLAFGATASQGTQNYAVHTSAYNTTTQAWSAGPNMPMVPLTGGVNYTMADAPAAILPNGNVLIAAGPGVWTVDTSYPTPTHFFIFDGKNFTQVGDVGADSARLSSFQMNFLVLPNGQILGVETDYPNMEIFPASSETSNALVCCANPSWAPTISAINGLATFPVTIVNGKTNTVSGTQFNGLTSGTANSDDVQASTNYPLVRVTNASTGRVTVTYCATFNFSTMGVATGSTPVSVDFTCNAPNGPSTLEVVANGIASAPVDVTIKTQPATTLYSFCSQGGSNCTDGAGPFGVIMDAQRNLYGTTSSGGTGADGGTVFELAFDPITHQYASAVRTLYSFCSQGGTNCTDGAGPAGLIMDGAGNLFGATSYGGGTGISGGGGTVFELSFESNTHQYASTVKTLYNFCSQGGSSCTDGKLPPQQLVMDASGNLYGTTLYGGGAGTNGYGGTLFELPFDSNTHQYATTVKTLYSFCSQGGSACTDGATPNTRLIMDTSGNLYGTTLQGGNGTNGGSGTIFELAFESSTQQYLDVVHILYRFCSQVNCTDGVGPDGDLIMDSSGNLYGTTYNNGGTGNNGGTVFELPINPATHQYQANLQTLYNFCSQANCIDGTNP